MAREFKLPDLGEGLTEAEIVQVLVAEGEEIKEDQAVLLVETEKAQVELPSPFGGRVAKIHVRPGQRVKVGSVLMSFGDGGSDRAQEKITARPGGPAVSVAEPRVEGFGGDSVPPPARTIPPAATPATRRLARELGVELAGVKGTGPGGRITDEDVRSVRAEGGKLPPSDSPTRGAATVPAGPAEAREAEPGRPLELRVELPPLPRFEQWGPIEREPLRGIRRRSAEHLALAWAVIPHVTQHDEADITALEALRRRHQARVRDGGGDLTLTVLVIKAAALVLKGHPRFNASLDHRTGELVLKRYYHIGVAVDTERGLVVPVVRDVDQKRIRDLAVELSQLVGRAREGKATLEELRGGTFTVTNTGALGGTGATPIINYPEVAILGLGRAREMPVVRDGQVVVRLILPLSLAFDHRVIDGMEAARLSAELVRLLEDPERLLLDA
ncbi:MAG TPA: dihydrolipoamide acetyltransferase family protein [Methylomirabilota bacterium]|nr:dihydrolipoamide acetyltransferase family protein [Methylomirabilota bacterium]